MRAGASVLIAVLLAGCLVSPRAPFTAAQEALAGEERVLILTSDAKAGAASTAGVYTVMLRNLLGRYPELTIETRSVADYRRGDAFGFLRVFYVGAVYGEEVPDGLVQDVMDGAPVAWINYGVWSLDRPAVGASLSRLGLEYVALHRADEPKEYVNAFREVEYRGQRFRKSDAPMEMIEVRAGPGTTVHAWAVARETGAGSAAEATERRIPYATQSGAFWYVADLPFAYMAETDRYLVFADLLAPMLGRAEECEPRAVVRIEDVDPRDDAADLKRALDLLAGRDVPFAAAVIPVHVSNEARRQGRPDARVEWGEDEAALAQLRRIPEIGGRVFQHGYTHQYGAMDNPIGSTGDDWEFWDVAADAPIESLSVRQAMDRVRTGRDVLVSLGLDVHGWVTPHYAFDPAMGEELSRLHPVAFERRLYAADERVAGQFFPFPVRDVYGGAVVPENAGSIQPDHGIPEILAAARANRALRCPWLGFFFHPEILAPDAPPESAVRVDELAGLIDEIRAMGYRFVDPLEAVGGSTGGEGTFEP